MCRIYEAAKPGIGKIAIKTSYCSAGHLIVINNYCSTETWK